MDEVDDVNDADYVEGENVEDVMVEDDVFGQDEIDEDYVAGITSAGRRGGRRCGGAGAGSAQTVAGGVGGWRRASTCCRWRVGSSILTGPSSAFRTVSRSRTRSM